MLSTTIKGHGTKFHNEAMKFYYVRFSTLLLLYPSAALIIFSILQYSKWIP